MPAGFTSEAYVRCGLICPNPSMTIRRGPMACEICAAGRAKNASVDGVYMDLCGECGRDIGVIDPLRHCFPPWCYEEEAPLRFWAF